MAAYVLAHLTDPHLPPLPKPEWHELIGKRALGYINWKRKRSAIHQRSVLNALIADLQSQTPDHIALTGDIVNIALEAEFPPARKFVAALSSPEDLTLVPGNHDLYVRATRTRFAETFAPYMRGDDMPQTAAPVFPFLRRRGPLAIIGISSAVPTLPFMATGTVGELQRHRLAKLLDRTRADNLFRVVLVHHPLQSTPSRWYKRLTDGFELRQLLARHGAELVLHGHDHRDALTDTKGPEALIPVVGTPSASGADDGHHDPAAYRLFRIARVRDVWHCEMITRGFERGQPGAIRELKRQRILPYGGY